MEYQGFHLGIIMSKAYTLYMNGLRYFMDIWDPSRYGLLLGTRDTKIRDKKNLKTRIKFQEIEMKSD